MWDRDAVVVEPPGFDPGFGLGKTGEPVFVEAFVAEFPVEAVDEGVVDRLSGTRIT